MLFARALVSFLVLPGVVAGLILVGSLALALYWLVLIVIFHLRVVFFEEAWLAKSFPAEWNAYRAAVPRWLPRISTGTRAERRDGER